MLLSDFTLVKNPARILTGYYHKVLQRILSLLADFTPVKILAGYYHRILQRIVQDHGKAFSNLCRILQDPMDSYEILGRIPGRIPDGIPGRILQDSSHKSYSMFKLCGKSYTTSWLLLCTVPNLYLSPDLCLPLAF